MAYRLLDHEPAADGLRRIAREQADHAIDRLENHSKEDRDEAIHDARKAFKQVRAILRLTRDQLGDDAYRNQQTVFRRSERRLSDARDAHTLVETASGLAGAAKDAGATGAYQEVRRALVRHRKAEHGRLDESDRLETVVKDVRAARVRITRWQPASPEFAAIGAGLERSYRRGRKALATVLEARSDENLHELRKRAKDLWYHSRILEPLWPGIMAAYLAEAHLLSDLLGDDHDLAVLRTSLLEPSQTLVAPPASDDLLPVLDRRRAGLQKAAVTQARRLYADKPGPYVGRMAEQWRCWRLEYPVVDDLDPMRQTRAELYERARTLGVNGRASMNKDELYKALLDRTSGV